MAARAFKRTGDTVVRSAPVVKYPRYIEPCLAKNVGRPPAGEGWAHEIKYDGFRSQLHIRDGSVAIYSSGKHDWTDRYRSVADEAAKLKVKHAIVDGEMVVLRNDGTCDFWSLQKNVRASVSNRLTYFAFDLLYAEGGDVRRLPFVERKELLRKLLGKNEDGRIRYVEHVQAEGPMVWAHAHNVNVEGIVSKRVGSPYRSARADDWIKTPCQYREELLIAGIAFDGDEFGGLYLARRKNGGWVYAGKVEDGFTDENVANLRTRLDPLVTRKQSVPTSTPKPDAKWVEPIVQVRILHRGGLTAERVRRPVFEGLVERAAARQRQSPPAISALRDNVMRELSDAVVPTPAELHAHWRKVAGRSAQISALTTSSTLSRRLRKRGIG